MTETNNEDATDSTTGQNLGKFPSMRKRSKNIILGFLAAATTVWGLAKPVGNAFIWLVGLVGLSEDWETLREMLITWGISDWGPWLLLTICLGSLYWVNFGDRWAFTKQPDKTRMARRWVRLSDDMLKLLSDAPDSRSPQQSPLWGSATDEQRSALWRQAADDLMNQSRKLMDRATLEFSSRAQQAADEMKALGIEIPRELSTLGGRVDLTNSFCINDWAVFIGAQGRQLLSDLDEHE